MRYHPQGLQQLIQGTSDSFKKPIIAPSGHLLQEDDYTLLNTTSVKAWQSHVI